ncbi:MAG: trypsin-like peptidase domain-containing protein [Waterburya sp.]
MDKLTLYRQSDRQNKTKFRLNVVKSGLLILLGAGLSLGINSWVNNLTQPQSSKVKTETAASDNNVPQPRTRLTSLQTRSSQSVADVVETAGAAVVTIDTTRRQTRGYKGFEKGGAFGRGFDDFFEDYSAPQRREPEARGSGSGFIIDGSGHIITNAHVVENADEVNVTLRDGRSFAGRVLGSDRLTDLAVIKIDAESLPSLALADSEQLRVGESAIAIGNPLGLDSTVTTGIISATGRSSGEVGVPDRRLEFIQTDAAINPGNSGGPLLNSQGQVIGINTAIIQNAQGLGFAIPSNTAQKVATQLIATGTVEHPYLGVQMVTLNSSVRQELGLLDLDESTQGVAIIRVMPNSPADRVRLQPRDIILQVGKEAITTASDLQRLVGSVDVGDELSLEVWRDGRKMKVTVTTDSLPTSTIR